MLYLRAKIIQLIGQVDSERSISVLRILKHHHYPLKFQRGLC
jgi:hypothetical protein